MVDPTTEPGQPERRIHDALRTLVDEMMAQIRDMSQHGMWTTDERQRAEQDLERVMAQVRREAQSDRSRD